ncbi:histidinol-phosphate aminotransferase, partial [Pasteurella multocida subsp. multocida str. Anand1_buffalo]
AKVAENNRQGLKLLEDFFTAKGLNYIPSKGNFVMLDVNQPALPIYQALLQKGVIVRPIAGYGLPNHLRISIGLPEENQRFLLALSEVLGL